MKDWSYRQDIIKTIELKMTAQWWRFVREPRVATTGSIKTKWKNFNNS